LRKEGRGKNRTVRSATAKKAFASGAFPEGRYEYWFTNASASSKHSQLVVTFDNAASTGYLSHPKPKSALTETARVAGAAVSGWKVFVDDKALGLDRQFRFNEQVKVGRDGVTVLFSHPRYGKHYYVRSRHSH